ncbi:glycosyltransferase family 2 protein, partial [Candidatus Sumerlaeota bacterium]|nr:glycosyltransferase family 2 protein [Candidatus Sumerlaeota bacterium]
ATLLVCMDADLTHPPELIPEMRRVMESGADMVIASRFQPGSEVVGLSAFRHLMSWGARNLFSAALAISGVRDYTCGFRAFRLSLIARGFERYGPEGLILRRGFACTDELLIKLSLLNPVIKEIPFILRYDLKRGKSKIKLGVTIMETLRLVRWARAQLRARRARTPD